VVFEKEKVYDDMPAVKTVVPKETVILSDV
jgi:hypothetical protein